MKHLMIEKGKVSEAYHGGFQTLRILQNRKEAIAYVEGLSQGSKEKVKVDFLSRNSVLVKVYVPDHGWRNLKGEDFLDRSAVARV